MEILQNAIENHKRRKEVGLRRGNNLQIQLKTSRQKFSLRSDPCWAGMDMSLVIGLAPNARCILRALQVESFRKQHSLQLNGKFFPERKLHWLQPQSMPYAMQSHLSTPLVFSSFTFKMFPAHPNILQLDSEGIHTLLNYP